jgi:hypothetical protein
MSPNSLNVLCSNSVTSDLPTSIRIICDLLRAGISEVCYHRNLLPDACFTDVVLNGIHGQTFACKLAVGSPMAGPKDSTEFGGDVINSWCIEVGRLLVTQKSAVSRVTFGFSPDEDLSVVLEEYLFDIDVRGSAPPQSGNSCQYQAMDIMEYLSCLVRTFDPVPWMHGVPMYMFVKAYLADGTYSSDTYLLTEASAGKNHGISYYDHETFGMKIGTLRTAHHSVTVGVCSVLDSVTDPKKKPLPFHERIPDNLGMCSSIENATDAPSPFQYRRMETPRSTRKKMLSDDMKKLQASPTSSSLDTGMTRGSNEDSMMTSDISYTDIGSKRNATADTKKSLKKRGKRLAALLSTAIRR